MKFNYRKNGHRYITFIFKKIDRRRCNNYRGITNPSWNTFRKVNKSKLEEQNW